MTAIDENGRVYFQGYVYGPDFVNNGFWVIEPDGTVRRIIEESQLITLNDDVEREVQDLHVLRGLHNHAGYRSGLNNHAEVAIRVEFTDGTVAIVVAQPADPCFGDLNADSHVDGADLAILLGTWGACDGNCTADLNDDQAVDGGDLALLLGTWGPCP